MSDRYFRRRECPAAITFEEEYWGIVRDPDGEIRDRRKERDRFLEDVKAEVSFLRSLQPGRILDVGCGLGFLLSALDDRWERHGVEISGFAARHAQQWGIIHHGDLESAQYPEDYFDVVVLYHVIEHMPDPVDTIREVHRILRPGGVLLLGTPDFESGCARLFGGNYRLLHDRTHISLFDADSVHRLLRDHGFVIDRVEFPFFETRHFTRENLLRLFDVSSVSPPFYGNFMTFYSHKPVCLHTVAILQSLGMCGREELAAMERRVEGIVGSMKELLDGNPTVGLWCDESGGSTGALAADIFCRAVEPVRVNVMPLQEGLPAEGGLGLLIRLEQRATSLLPKHGSLPCFVLVPEGRQTNVNTGGHHILQFPVPLSAYWSTIALLVLEALGRDVARASGTSAPRDI